MVVGRWLVMSYLMGMLTLGPSVSPKTSASMRTSFSVPTIRRGSVMSTVLVDAQAAKTATNRAASEARFTLRPPVMAENATCVLQNCSEAGARLRLLGIHPARRGCVPFPVHRDHVEEHRG